MNSRILVLVLATVMAAVAGGCSKARSEKIPLTTRSDEAKAHFLKGMEYTWCAKQDAARAEFAAAAIIDSDFAMAYAGLAMVQSSIGDMYDIANQAETMSRPEERAAGSRAGFGLRIDAFAGNKPSAELVGQATKRISKVSEGERLWILSLQAQLNGDARARFESCSTLVALYPKDERARCFLGDAYAERDQLEAAIDQYRQAIVLTPDCAPAYNMLGYYCVRKGDMPSAEQAFRKQTEILPGEANPRDSFAEFLLTQGRYEESLENYKQALALDPGFVNARVGAATNLILLGKYDDAQSYLVRPGDDSLSAAARGMLKLAQVLCCYDRGDHDGAYGLMRELVEFARTAQSPVEATANLNMLGRMLLADGKLDEAKRVFIEQQRECDAAGFPAAIRRRQEAVHAALNSCLYEITAGNINAARGYAETLTQLASAQGEPAYLQLSHWCTGLVDYHAGNYAAAIRELEQASPHDSFRQYYLGMAYEKSGERARAVENFKQASRPKTLNKLDFFLVRGQVREALERTQAVAAAGEVAKT